MPNLQTFAWWSSEGKHVIVKKKKPVLCLTPELRRAAPASLAPNAAPRLFLYSSKVLFQSPESRPWAGAPVSLHNVFIGADSRHSRSQAGAALDPVAQGEKRAFMSRTKERQEIQI